MRGWIRAVIQGDGAATDARLRISILVTAVGIVLAVAHIILPFIAIDAITVALLLVAISPWLGHVFKAFEFPGLGRVEYWDLVRAETELTKAGLTATPTAKQRDVLSPSASTEPWIPLAALRIEIEKRLRELAGLEGIRLGNRPGSIAMLARELGSSGVITTQQSTALIGMADTLNRAVHARPVEASAAEWALTVGPSVLASLDAKVSTVAASASKTSGH